MTITTIVLAKDAEKDLKACLESLLWSDEILVIDDNSSDATAHIAKKIGARVVSHALDGDFAKQRNFSLQKAKGEWVLFVDSDEIVSKELAKEIQEVVHNDEMQGYYLRRKDILWGKEIMHGEQGSIKLLRLAKKDSGFWEGLVHETWHVVGNTGVLNHALSHHPHATLTEFLEELNWYTSLRAQELHQNGVKMMWFDILLYPKAKFLQNYIVKMGFLDGTIGLVLAILMSFHSFLVRGKLWQLQKNK